MNTNALSPIEESKLVNAEAQILRALAAIRDERLYREHYADFTAYLWNRHVQTLLECGDCSLVDTSCPKGGDHEWTQASNETFCRKCELLLDSLPAYTAHMAACLRDVSVSRAERVWLAAAAFQAVLQTPEDSCAQRLGREVHAFAMNVCVDLVTIAFQNPPVLSDKVAHRARTVLAKVAKAVDRLMPETSA